jgi:hypothetical protein
MNNGYDNDMGTTPVDAPWKQSKKGAIYCMWNDLRDDLKTQLKEEHRFQTRIGQFHYYVLKTDEGSYLVFRNPKPENESQRNHYFSDKPQNSVRELKVLPLEEANMLLQSSDEYLLIGNDPLKVVNGHFFAILGKRRNQDEIGGNVKTTLSEAAS